MIADARLRADALRMRSIWSARWTASGDELTRTNGVPLIRIPV